MTIEVDIRTKVNIHDLRLIYAWQKSRDKRTGKVTRQELYGHGKRGVGKHGETVGRHTGIQVIET